MVGHDALKSGEQHAREAVSRVGFLRAVGIDKGDDAGGMADQRAGRHIGNIVKLLNGIQNFLNGLWGNTLIVAVDDI